MIERNSRDAGETTSELWATIGLVTMLGAVVSAVSAVVALGDGSLTLAGFLGLATLVSFAVSLACFFSDSNRAEESPLPFPSWLRSDAEPAAELSAAG